MVKFGKGFGVAVASGALAAALSAAVSSLGYYAIMMPGTQFNAAREPGDFLAARADGRFLYAYNGMSDDVTIVETETGRVIEKFAVGGGCRGIGFGPGRRLLWAASSGQVTVIDAESNRVKHQHALKESLNGFFFLDSGARAVALVRKSLLIFDAVTGSMITETAGYSDPVLLLEPSTRR